MTESEAAEEGRFARVVTLGLLVACVVAFAYYVFSDRVTPYTNQARIGGFVVPIAPEVSGPLVEVRVGRHDRVETGDLLARIDAKPYEFALRSAQASLTGAKQRVAAQAAAVDSAEGGVASAVAQLDIAERDFERMEGITKVNPGALSQADRDRTTAALAGATAQLAAAQAERDRARESLGVEGPANPSIQSAVVKLDRAQLDLERTTIRAPAPGLVESIDLDVGYVAAAGQPIMSVISLKDVWIEAHMTENNLEHIAPGSRARFILDSAPGRIFEGSVRSVGYGVTEKQGEQRGELPTVVQSTGWMRDPQRFPVIIEIADEDLHGLLRAGGQATVVVYTGEHGVMNSLAGLRMRVSSWLSYAR